MTLYRLSQLTQERGSRRCRRLSSASLTRALVTPEQSSGWFRGLHDVHPALGGRTHEQSSGRFRRPITPFLARSEVRHNARAKFWAVSQAAEQGTDDVNASDLGLYRRHRRESRRGTEITAQNPGRASNSSPFSCKTAQNPGGRYLEGRRSLRQHRAARTAASRRDNRPEPEGAAPERCRNAVTGARHQSEGHAHCSPR